MANKVNTRIVLKNDYLSSWLSSTSLSLLNGEIALARMDNGKYELRVGQAGKQYSGAAELQLSASQVVGLTETLNALSTSFTEAGALSDLPTNVNNGSIGVVTADIDGTHTSYTAYYYDATAKAWKAMDGNYSADNVYFDEDITLAGSYTAVGNVKISDGTIAAKGMNVKSLMDKIFDQTIQPTLSTNPSASITLTGAGKKEVGTTFTPSWSVSYTQGKYGHPWDNTTVNDGTSATAYSITDGTTTSAASSGTFTAFTVLSSTSYKVTGTVTYSDGTVATDNKGNASNPTVQRTGSTLTASASGTVTGVFPAYYGFTTSPKSNPTAITATDGNVTVDGITYTRDTLNGTYNKTSFTASSKWYELFYMIPTGKHTSWSGKDSNNVDLAIDTKTTATVTFKDGTTATYDVFVVRNAAQYSATTCTMSFK